MFSSALKTFNSNILSNYTIAPQPSTSAGPWKVFDAKRKQSGKAVSVFVFEKKSLDPGNGGFNSRSSGGMSVKRAQEEVIERLKKEASSLARLRHPSILELAEPVEETAKGGLMFATEPVTASLAELLRDKDDQERSGGARGRSSRYVVEDSNGTNTTKRELEIDELEIQKGLLQIAKGLEFLHDTGGLVHANFTPDAILINTKGDWKISGLAFCGPHESCKAATSLVAISLHEVLNHDPRLPRHVQLNLDYTSPDFVLDNTLSASADMFSLGLLIISLYNSPHSSPLNTGGSLSSYKRVFSSSSTIPTRNNNFLVPSSHPLPGKLAAELLPRLITRRAAQRLSAKEFQEASYFDNILVSTIRFLEDLPAKSANEKSQFMRGLPRIMPQFPASVLEKKVLPALLEEMKDRDLLAPIMGNIFAMFKAMPKGQRSFATVVVPRLKEVFVMNKSADKDTAREAGLMVLLENMSAAVGFCPGREFREDILPIVLVAFESPTHSVVDAALRTLPELLKVLDFSTIKNEVFPVIASVFGKTSSLNIKIRGLEAFYTLCGGTSGSGSSADDDVYGLGEADKKSSAGSGSVILDKYTVQEKIVPLLRGIKTKEPAVMMAALNVFKQVGEVADTEFIALNVLPIMWHMSLGPLLSLQQFQAFMSLIKDLGNKIEREQTKKLRELAGSANSSSGAGDRGRQTGNASFGGLNGLSNGEETDFETLVSGRKHAAGGNDDLMSEWGLGGPQSSSTATSTSAFAWQSQPTVARPATNALRTQQQLGAMRTITPDNTLSNFASLQPSSTQFSQPLQPTQSTSIPMRPTMTTQPSNSGSIDWSAATRQQQSASSFSGGFGATSKPTLGAGSGFNILPPPTSPPLQAPVYGQPRQTQSTFAPSRPPQQQPASTSSGQSNTQKTGLDKYESLL